MYVPPLEASPFAHQSPFPSAPVISPASSIPHRSGDSTERWLEHPVRPQNAVTSLDLNHPGKQGTVLVLGAASRPLMRERDGR
ncbi:hypothetical protein N7533_012348 [Penicillium manginii]|uniref:uncharacterized protein n=1 Tax=Penicillium manginii TaxID=203109 RepID=UPI002546766D|nr:uncharacterized protein N7533_012348 [Penicillium manginii]KAJ5739564.1 hypothetical protein N7533_012348 [Penicillium manginii]